MCWVQNQNLWNLAGKKTNEKFIWDIMSSDDRLQYYNLLSVCTRWPNPMILFIALTSYVGNLPIFSNFFVKNVGRLWDYTTKRSSLGTKWSQVSIMVSRLANLCSTLQRWLIDFHKTIQSHGNQDFLYTASLSVAASVTFFRKCHVKDKSAGILNNISQTSHASWFAVIHTMFKLSDTIFIPP